MVKSKTFSQTFPVPESNAEPDQAAELAPVADIRFKPHARLVYQAGEVYQLADVYEATDAAGQPTAVVGLSYAFSEGPSYHPASRPVPEPAAGIVLSAFTGYIYAYVDGTLKAGHFVIVVD